MIFFPLDMKGILHEEQGKVEDGEARVHRAGPVPSAPFAVGYDNHRGEEKGEKSVNKRPPFPVLTLGFEEELFEFVHVVVLPSIRSES